MLYELATDPFVYIIYHKISWNQKIPMQRKATNILKTTKRRINFTKKGFILPFLYKNMGDVKN